MPKMSGTKVPVKCFEELPPIICAQHIADYLSISRRRVYELFDLIPQAGGIPNFDVGYSKRVRKEDFAAWIDAGIKGKSRSA